MPLRLATVRQHSHELNRSDFIHVAVRLDPIGVVLEFALAVLAALRQEQRGTFRQSLAQLIRPSRLGWFTDRTILLTDQFRDPRCSKQLCQSLECIFLRTCKHMPLEYSEGYKNESASALA